LGGKLSILGGAAKLIIRAFIIARRRKKSYILNQLFSLAGDSEAFHMKGK